MRLAPLRRVCLPMRPFSKSSWAGPDITSRGSMVTRLFLLFTSSCAQSTLLLVRFPLRFLSLLDSAVFGFYFPLMELFEYLVALCLDPFEWLSATYLERLWSLLCDLWVAGCLVWEILSIDCLIVTLAPWFRLFCSSDGREKYLWLSLWDLAPLFVTSDGLCCWV